jgi:hypothetical protein
VAAASPEELETLLEDALLLDDDGAVADLFEDRGVLVPGPGRVRGRAHAAEVLSPHDFAASARSVTVVRDVAVVVGDHTVNVSCRGLDRSWRLVVAIVMPLSCTGYDGPTCGCSPATS